MQIAKKKKKMEFVLVGEWMWQWNTIWWKSVQALDRAHSPYAKAKQVTFIKEINYIIFL